VGEAECGSGAIDPVGVVDRPAAAGRGPDRFQFVGGLGCVDGTIKRLPTPFSACPVCCPLGVEILRSPTLRDLTNKKGFLGKAPHRVPCGTRFNRRQRPKTLVGFIADPFKIIAELIKSFEVLRRKPATVDLCSSNEERFMELDCQLIDCTLIAKIP